MRNYKRENDYLPVRTDFVESCLRICQVHRRYPSFMMVKVSRCMSHINKYVLLCPHILVVLKVLTIPASRIYPSQFHLLAIEMFQDKIPKSALALILEE